MTRDQVLGLMAASIYAIRSASNPQRHRLETLRKEAVKEAADLLIATEDRAEFLEPETD